VQPNNELRKVDSNSQFCSLISTSKQGIVFFHSSCWLSMLPQKKPKWLSSFAQISNSSDVEFTMEWLRRRCGPHRCACTLKGKHIPVEQLRSGALKTIWSFMLKTNGRATSSNGLLTSPMTRIRPKVLFYFLCMIRCLRFGILRVSVWGFSDTRLGLW
jgi:hypothetical protein